jgi:hypothetical protein
MPASISHAGDVIDFLPEVETARSFSAVLIPIVTLPFTIFPHPSVCIDENLPTEIPNHLLYDSNGVFNSFEEILFVLRNINCRFLAAGGEVAIIPEAEILLNYFLALRGENIELSNGNILEGEKQSVRAASIIFGGSLLTAVLQAGELSIIEESDQSPCDFLHEQISHGKTIELRFASLFALLGDLLANSEGMGIGCIHELDASDEELVELVQMGNVEAAVNLADRWSDLVDRETGVTSASFDVHSLEETQALLNAKLAELGIEILQSTERFPLLTLAIAFSSVQLHSFLFLIDFAELIRGL